MLLPAALVVAREQIPVHSVFGESLMLPERQSYAHLGSEAVVCELDRFFAITRIALAALRILDWIAGVAAV